MCDEPLTADSDAVSDCDEIAQMDTTPQMTIDDTNPSAWRRGINTASTIGAEVHVPRNGWNQFGDYTGLVDGGRL